MYWNIFSKIPFRPKWNEILLSFYLWDEFKHWCYNMLFSYQYSKTYHFVSLLWKNTLQSNRLTFMVTNELTVYFYCSISVPQWVLWDTLVSPVVALSQGLDGQPHDHLVQVLHHHRVILGACNERTPSRHRLSSNTVIRSYGYKDVHLKRLSSIGSSGGIEENWLLYGQ